MNVELIDLTKQHSEAEWKKLLDALMEKMEECRLAGDLAAWNKVGGLFSKCYDLYYAKFKEAEHGPIGNLKRRR